MKNILIIITIIEATVVFLGGFYFHRFYTDYQKFKQEQEEFKNAAIQQINLLTENQQIIVNYVNQKK